MGGLGGANAGAGQEKPAEAIVQRFAKSGGWVMLQNLHLMQDWVPVLERMLEIACPGQTFTSPAPDQMLAAAQAADMGKGVLFIVKNYAGDFMNFEMAGEMPEMPDAAVRPEPRRLQRRPAPSSLLEGGRSAGR